MRPAQRRLVQRQLNGENGLILVMDGAGAEGKGVTGLREDWRHFCGRP
jgi:hypothetical protein